MKCMEQISELFIFYEKNEKAKIEKSLNFDFRKEKKKTKKTKKKLSPDILLLLL